VKQKPLGNPHHSHEKEGDIEQETITVYPAPFRQQRRNQNTRQTLLAVRRAIQCPRETKETPILPYPIPAPQRVLLPFRFSYANKIRLQGAVHRPAFMR
jgi:hypothetical protein